MIRMIPNGIKLKCLRHNKINSFAKIAKEIVIKEKELNINIIIVTRKKGRKNDSNLRFFLRV